jgi:hypothetical protein
MLMGLIGVLTKVLKIVPLVLLVLAILEQPGVEAEIVATQLESPEPDVVNKGPSKEDIENIGEEEALCFLRHLVINFLGFAVIILIIGFVAPDHSPCVSLPPLILMGLHRITQVAKMSVIVGKTAKLPPTLEIPYEVQFSDLADFGPLGWENLIGMLPV